ncbi:hypothetical protein ILUMI_05453 [Ignelater luminosus]|uniref:Uncharacterized protein n=1 Tax=Ignelater luminosus TaxID=2038154 RepID=A0A8K0GI40_IGNLU|nr:hypothetical protein ILUMI_05453 [Ignelater luminosus]
MFVEYVKQIMLKTNQHDDRMRQNSKTKEKKVAQETYLDKRFGVTNRLKIATWNVQELGQKELKKKTINIAVITKTEKKLNGTKDLDDYVMIYSRVDLTRAQCGVAILIDNDWNNKLQSYYHINERIVTTSPKIGRGYLTIIGEEGKREATEKFY